MPRFIPFIHLFILVIVTSTVHPRLVLNHVISVARGIYKIVTPMYPWVYSKMSDTFESAVLPAIVNINIIQYMYIYFSF